jgi:predicted CoA-binding protein
MPLSSRADIDAFLALKRIAVVGVSRSERSYSRMVYQALVERGYDVAAVNRGAAEIAGKRSFAAVGDVKPAVEGALILTPTAEYAGVAAECRRTGLERLWCRFKAAGIESELLIQDECPMMWLSNTEWFHGLHKGLRQLVGTLPK